MISLDKRNRIQTTSCHIFLFLCELWFDSLFTLLYASALHIQRWYLLHYCLPCMSRWMTFSPFGLYYCQFPNSQIWMPFWGLLLKSFDWMLRHSTSYRRCLCIRSTVSLTDLNLFMYDFRDYLSCVMIMQE